MLFVPERRRSRRLQSAIRAERALASRAIKRSGWSTQTRIARRRIEEERTQQEEQSNIGSRVAVLRRREPTCFSSASDDEVGDFPARSARSERSEWSNQTTGYWSEGADKSITSLACLLLHGGA